MTDKILVIVPARGGSKGIPGKNLVEILGYPLLYWTVRAARAARKVSRIVVSTDDPPIAQAAREWGADVVERPPELATDQSPSEAALIHAVNILQTKEQWVPDIIVFLQATSPVREGMDIDAAVTLLIEGEYDSVFSAYREHFVGRWRREDSGKVKPVNYEPQHRPRRQDCPLEFIENGNIYVVKTELLLKTSCRLGGAIGVYEMPKWKSVQIDEPDDIRIAEAMLRRMLDASKDDTPLKHLKGLAFDFDGVMTDNRVWVSEKGEESVACNRSDGLAISLLKDMGLDLIVISSEKNEVVDRRCRKLGVPCLHGVQSKSESLARWVSDRGFSRDEVAYVGNDLNDLECMRFVGVPITVSDAHPAVRKLARIQLERQGGAGAILELAERIQNVRTISEKYSYEES